MTDEQKYKWAYELLTDAFGERWGFPKGKIAIQLYVRGFLDIVGDIKERRMPKEGGGEEVVCEARTIEHQGVALVRECFVAIDRCPSPIQMRQIYEKNLHHKPADGRSSDQMMLESGG